MKSAATYSFINAKVFARVSRLFTDAQIRTLAAAPSLNHMLSTLQSWDRNDLAEKLSTDKSEYHISKTLLEDELAVLFDLHKSSPRNLRDLLILMREWYDLENIKGSLRYIHNHSTALQPLLFTEKTRYNLFYDEIMQKKTIKEALPDLEKTPYKQAIENSLADYEKDGRLIHLEYAIDRDYYKRLLGWVSERGRLDKTMLTRILGTYIDVLTVRQLIRLRRYYDMDAGEIAGHIVTKGFRFTVPQLVDAYANDELIHLITLISKRSSARDMLDKKPSELNEESLGRLESMLWYVLGKEAKSLFSTFPFHAGIIVSYIFLKKIESRNLRIVLTGKLLGMSTEEITNTLTFLED